MTQGRWVVLEDVDRAPFEVLSALIPLMEMRMLLAAGEARRLPHQPTHAERAADRGEVVRAAPGFQLFATRTTSR